MDNEQVRITFDCTDEMKDHFRRLSKQTGVPMAEIIRIVLARYLARN